LSLSYFDNIRNIEITQVSIYQNSAIKTLLVKKLYFAVTVGLINIDIVAKITAFWL
jgi:hypothetical protein